MANQAMLRKPGTHLCQLETLCWAMQLHTTGHELLSERTQLECV